MMNLVLVASILLAALIVSGCFSVMEQNIPDYEVLVFYYEILKRVEQPLKFVRWVREGESLLLNKTYYEEWTLPMERFHRAILEGTLLPKVGFFGLLIKSHQLEALGLYHFLSKTLEWESFVKNACWARRHTHPHMFVYAFTRTVVERRYHVQLLPYIYEMLPRHFFNWKLVEAVEKFAPANSHIQAAIPESIPISNTANWRWWKTLGLSEEQWYVEKEQEIRNGIVEATDDRVKLWWRPNDYTHSSALSYLTEDADWNSYWYLMSINYSTNINSFHSNWKNRLYSEHWVFFLQKFLARYYLERLSHGMGAIPEFDWQRSYDAGYDCELVALNGKRFVSRPVGWIPKNGSNCIDCFKKVRETMEYIKAVIDEGSLLLQNGSLINFRAADSLFYIMQLFRGHMDPHGNFLESYWYSLAHMHFANATQHNNAAPHDMLNLETMAREPFFYTFQNEIVKLLNRFQSYLPPYTSIDLHHTGIKILAANNTQLLTYEETFDFDVSNLGHDNLFARRPRLNHRPFHFNITIESDQHRNILLRIYIGPKYDQYGRAFSLNANRLNFIELTNLVVRIHTGVNALNFTYADIFDKNIENNYFQSELYHCALNVDCQRFVSVHVSKTKNCVLDNHLLLPRGWINGMPMQLFFMAFDDDLIGPQQVWWRSCHTRIGERSLGYPFDRSITNEKDFIGPNMLLKNVKIFHEESFALRNRFKQRFKI